ncbi:Orsellinic acid synthase ArmB [Colletotrichum spinosum]|uniref:Orsellinic acid synthase ArmB n=1 Tax=Colletotrichum spinosum TaxID=1347390 RepID=A0A4R8QH35_9PEZI|nr:Orsellinic acid synthase ArmB [Colletotrichum spinosum]
MSPDRAGNLISTKPALSELTVACLNGVDDCVIGGPLDQISEFQGHCKARKIKTKVLDVPFAFHTKAMDPILDHLEALGRSIGFATPTVPIISNVFGCFFQAEHLTGSYFALHAREPVRFSEGLLDLQSSAPLHNALFLDIGPHPSTIPMVRSLNRHGSSTYLGTLQKSQKAWESISATLASISLLKTPVNWREVFAGTSASMLSGLPGHPLKGPEFFVPYREQLQSVEQGETSLPSLRTKTRFNLLPWLKPQPAPSDTFVFETTLQILGLLISGHDVGGTAICPASLFHELALEAVETAIPPLVGQTLVVTNMVFASPLVYKPSKEASVSVHLTKHTSDGGADFQVSSTSAGDPTESLHCTGVVSLRDQDVFDSRQIKDAALMKRQKQYFDTVGKEHCSIFRTRVLYEVVFPRVVRYSPEYQSIHHLRVSDSNLEGIGSFKLAREPGTGYVSHPVFTDSILHAAGFIANTAVKDRDVCICARVDAVEISYRDMDFGGTFQIYCSLLEVKGAFLADAIVMDASGQVIAAVRGMTFSRLRLSTFQRMLARKSTDADNEIVMDVGGFSIEDMDYNKPLDELGIDSLMQIEIASGLARAFPFADKMNHRTLSQCETLGSLEIALGLMLQSSAEPTSVVGSPKMVDEQPPDSPTPAPSTRILSDSIRDNPVALHTCNRESTPLCLFHDGSGQTTTYARLSGYDRDVFAFFDPSFGSTRKRYETIPQMAEDYVSLLSKSTHSPLMVGGWSFGGVVAFEAARQLLSKGFEVKGLVLIDSPSPVNHRPLPKEIITSITRSSRSDGQPREGKHNAALEEEFQRNASLLQRYGADPSAMARMPGLKTVMLRSQDVMDTESLVGLRYDWLSSQNDRDASIAAWESLVCGHIKVLPIPGNHFEAFSPANIAATGSQLWKACQHIESS